jgi:hypothetical protein
MVITNNNYIKKNVDCVIRFLISLNKKDLKTKQVMLQSNIC